MFRMRDNFFILLGVINLLKMTFPENDKRKLKKKGRFPYGWFGGTYKNLETSLMGDRTDNFGISQWWDQIGRLEKKLFFNFLTKHTASKQQDKFDHLGKDFDSIRH